MHDESPKLHASLSEPPIPSKKPLAFYCEHRHKCKWQGFKLHQGLGWGEIPSEHDKWTWTHTHVCGGRLIQIYDE